MAFVKVTRTLTTLNIPSRRYQHSGWRVILFASSDFGLQSIEMLHQETQKMDGIVKSVSLVTGKRTPIGEFAVNNSIPILPWPPEVDSEQFDIGVVASFGHLIPGRIINSFPNGMVNIHPSLLPRWRGAAPITHTILAGDSETAVSIMEIRPKHFDIGSILMQRTIPVQASDTTHQLSQRLSVLGAELLMKTLLNLNEVRKFGKPQSNEGVMYAHKLNPEMANVNWREQTCEEIDRQYRALHEQMPLRSRYLGTTIQLLDMIPLGTKGLDVISDVLPGSVEYLKSEDFVRIKCKDGYVGFRNFVYKKPMSAASFHNGYLSKPYNKMEYLESVENYIMKYVHVARIPT